MKTSGCIILIDDDRAWLEVLSEYLRTKGFAVQAATNPRRGIAMARTGDASLIVCDYNMPDMDGLQLIRELRRRQVSSAVLMMSSQEEPTLAAKALAEGADAFVIKGIAPSQLVGRIRQMIERTALQAAGKQALRIWQRLLPMPQMKSRRLSLNYHATSAGAAKCKND